MSSRYREDLEVREPYYVRNRAEFNSQPRYPRSRRMRAMLPSLSTVRSSRPLLQHPLSQRSLLLGFEGLDQDAGSPVLFGSLAGFRGIHQRHGSGPISLGLERDLLGERKWGEPRKCIVRSQSTAEVDPTRCRFVHFTPLPIAPKKNEPESIQQRILLRRFKKPVPLAPEILFQAPPTRQRARIKPKRRRLIGKQTEERQKKRELEGEQESGGEDWEESAGEESEGGNTAEEDNAGKDTHRREREKDWWESESDTEVEERAKQTKATTPINDFKPRLLSACSFQRPSSCLPRYKLPPALHSSAAPVLSSAALNSEQQQTAGICHDSLDRGSVELGASGEKLSVEPEANEENIPENSGENIAVETKRIDKLAFVTADDVALIAGDRREADTEDYPSTLQGEVRRLTNSDSEESASIALLQEDSRPVVSFPEAAAIASPAESSAFIGENSETEADVGAVQIAGPGTSLPGITEESMLTGTMETRPSILSSRVQGLQQPTIPVGRFHVSLERRSFGLNIRGAGREETWAVGLDEPQVEEEQNLSYHSDIPLGEKPYEDDQRVLSSSHRPWRPSRSSLPASLVFPSLPTRSQRIVLPTTSTSISYSTENTARESVNMPFTAAAAPKATITDIAKGKEAVVPLAHNKEEAISLAATVPQEYTKEVSVMPQVRDNEAIKQQEVLRPVSAEVRGSPKVKPSLHPMKKASVLLSESPIYTVENQQEGEESQLPALLSADPFEELILRISTSVLVM